MTSLNVVDVAGKVFDPAMTNCTGPMLLDRSSEYETFIRVSTQAAPVSAGAGEPVAFNSVDVVFNYPVTPGNRIRFDKSYLKIEYKALNVTNPAVPIAIDPTHVSIPWNTVSALVRDCDFQLNADNRSVERHTTEYGHSNMIKTLLYYSHDALERGHHKFFTPCTVGETRDLTTGLSANALTRAGRWLAAGGVAIEGAKSVMLSDMFDSMRVQSAWLLSKFFLTIRFNNAGDILIHDAADANINKLFITNVTLYLCVNKLTADQVAEDTKMLASNTSPMINSFRYFDVTTTPAKQTIAYENSPVKNLQACVGMISSIRCADGVGANPYQYTYGSGLVANTGITDYHQMYGSYYAPMEYVAVDRTFKVKNVDLMINWETLLRLINEKKDTDPIEFTTAMGTSAAGVDPNAYVFFTSVFCNQDTAPRKQQSGVVHKFSAHGLATGPDLLMVRIRLAGLRTGGDMSIEVLE